MGHKFPTNSSTWSISRWLPWHWVPHKHQVSQKCHSRVHPLGSPTVIPISGTWILKPRSALPWIRRFPRCVQPAALSSLSLVSKGSTKQQSLIISLSTLLLISCLIHQSLLNFCPLFLSRTIFVLTYVECRLSQEGNVLYLLGRNGRGNVWHYINAL